MYSDKKTGFFPLVKESLRAASNLRSWCNGSLWGRTRLGCKYSSASRRPAHISAKHQKTRQKLRLKNSSNWRTILLHITVWRFLNMKHTQWPETEIMWLYCCLGKFVKWFQVNHIFAHNSLTIFEYLACIMTGNGNHVTLLLLGKIREMISGKSYFCTQQFDDFWIFSMYNDRKRKSCDATFVWENSWNDFGINHSKPLCGNAAVAVDAAESFRSW